MSTLKELEAMTTEDVLRQARREVGLYWVQGALGTPGNEVCALGAVSSVMDLMTPTGGIAYPSEYKPKTKKQKRMQKLAFAACEQLYKALPAAARIADEGSSSHAEAVAESIVTYNDYDGRHKRTITKWFDRAIDISAK